MTSNHERPAGVPKPVSPLPWEKNDPALDGTTTVASARGTDVAVLALPPDEIQSACDEADFAYAIHATNALPGVVAERDELANDNVALLEDNVALRSELAKREREVVGLRRRALSSEELLRAYLADRHIDCGGSNAGWIPCGECCACRIGKHLAGLESEP